MRILLPITHALHRRNMIASGLVEILEKRGHRVEIFEDVKPRWARLRRTLRLMTLVQGELRSQTYRHKATLRRGRARLEAAVWRVVRRRGVDLESAAMRIEAALPLTKSREIIHAILPVDLVLWPTLLHMDAIENDLIKTALAIDVPVVAAPASWDTLTTKGAFLARPNRVIVWGAAAAAHACQIHGFLTDQVEPTGPPHFWPYESGVEPLGDQILVAGTSLHYWAEEQAFVTELERHFPGRVLHRPHPRSVGVWDQNVEGPARDLRRAGIIVAAFSTIVIEAALMGRPSILVAFGTGEQGRTVDHLAYDHMAEVAKWPHVAVARSMDELAKYVAAFDGNKVPLRSARSRALRIAYCEPGVRDRFADAVERSR